MSRIRLGDFITLVEKIDDDEFFGQLIEIFVCEWGGYFMRLVDDCGNDVTVHSGNVKTINGVYVSNLSYDKYGLKIEVL
ncbi:hypothetical protein VPHK567_0060 [Vibrio phage K567]